MGGGGAGFFFYWGGVFIAFGDYAYIRRDDEEVVATLLVMRDRDSKALRAWVLEHKGADLVETVDRAVAGVRQLGYNGRVLIRTDGEPALVALRNAIIKGLPDGATPVSTPVGESASNGVMEVAVKIMKGMLRVHLAALETKISARFPSGHAVLSWLVEHVTDLITKYTSAFTAAQCAKKAWSSASCCTGATSPRRT